MKTTTLELTTTHGEPLTLRLVCYANGRFDLLNTVGFSFVKKQLWEGRHREAWLGASSHRHLVPLIDAAFEALKEDTNA